MYFRLDLVQKKQAYRTNMFICFLQLTPDTLHLSFLPSVWQHAFLRYSLPLESLFLKKKFQVLLELPLWFFLFTLCVEEDCCKKILAILLATTNQNSSMINSKSSMMSRRK